MKMFETILELCNPLLVAQIVDKGISSGSLSYILRYVMYIVVCNLLCFGFAVIGQKCSTLVSTRVGTGLRRDLFSKVADFSHAELDKFGTASLINRLTNDIFQIENAVGAFMRLLLRLPFYLVGSFVLSLIINPKMSLVFLVLIPVFGVVLYFYMKKTGPYYSKIRDKLDSVGKVTRENLSGTRVIRAFNKQEAEQTRFESVSDDYSKTCIRVSKISSLLHPFVLLVVNFSTIAILALGGWQIHIGNMSQGDVIALTDYVSIITISLLMLSQVIAMFVRTIASIKRVNEVIYTEPSVKEKNTRKLTRLEYDALMEFDNVCFNYSFDAKEKSFIKDLSFKIYPHQTIGIIGGTGSGKTTIASLMTRFYDVTQGKILYKGKDIKDFSLKQLREEVSIVQQRSVLFSGSLRENMLLRNEKATDEEIIEALKISQAWPFVSEWSNTLDYQIMAGGKNVSGGQMQRLTIARALINKPELLILDDSSSALDFMTEKNLRNELKKLDCALVLISQRATSIQRADLIIVLDNGDVVGMGKHKDLLENCEIYREIYESQSK